MCVIFTNPIERSAIKMDKYIKKFVFDVEVLPHLFVLSWQELYFYDVVGDPKATHSIKEACSLIRENKDVLWVGYNSNGYDDYIMSVILSRNGDVTPEELHVVSDKIIEGGEDLRMQKAFLSYDCFDPVEAGMRSLKMYCGSSGRSTYDSPYSFKDDRYYNEEEIEDIKRYCKQDVSYTTEVFIREKGFYEAASARLDILKDCGVNIANPNKAMCCRSAAFGRYLFQSLCGSRNPKDNARTTIKFIRRYETSPYEEVRNAFAYYNKVVMDGDELSDNSKFYDKDVTPSFPSFTPEMGINLGWGGAHGAIEGYKFTVGNGRALLYVDVSSMYPTLLVKHDLYPHTFSKGAKIVYEFTYKSRLSYKANGEAIKSQACKRIIASLTGMLKDKFATFRAEWSNNSIVINGQLAILDMACRLREVSDDWRLVQVNTDGVMVEVPDTNEARNTFDRIASDWCEDYKFEVSRKEIACLIQTNVNNYYMTLVGHEDEEPDLKGAAYAYNEGYFRDKVVVKKATVDCLKDGMTPMEALARYKDIRDYFILIKNTDTFPYLWEILSDEKKEARCVRVIAVKKNMKKVFDLGLTPCYYIKSRRADDTEGQKVTNFPENAVELASDLSRYNQDELFEILDYDYYADQIQRAVDIFNGTDKEKKDGAKTRRKKKAEETA